MCETQKDGENVDPVNNKVDLDTILINEIGQFGKYQLRTLALVTIGVAFSAFNAQYVFTTARIPTRCLIPECEDPSATEFAPPWLQHAVPTSADGSFDECQRFNSSLPTGGDLWNETCPASLFDTSVRRDCEHHVYKNTHTVVYDFELGCDEWRRSLIGFVRTFGTFASLPLTGYVSDRWGRRTALALNCFNTAWLGLLRYFVTTYTGFMISQIFEAIFGSGVFSTTYILVLELVGPEYRVVAGGILSSCFALGNVLMGLVAWAIPDWRSLTLALYIPQLITIGYFWLISESVRWYLSKGRYAQSEALLKEAARINGKQLSDKSLQLLRLTTEEEKKRKAIEELVKAKEPWLIVLVLKHKQVLIRCLVLPVWWVTTTLTYYGLSINAVNMSGNQFVNYITVSAVEIPGFWMSVFLLSKIGRKPVMMGAFWICAACQLAYVFMPTDMYGLSLGVYLVGKCAISMVVTAIYVYTTELFPTQYRHNLFAFSSMIGRIGSFTAPLTPAIGAATFEEMPFVLFGSFALVSGCLVLFTPETLGTKLPDTMEEADNLGNKKL